MTYIPNMSQLAYITHRHRLISFAKCTRQKHSRLYYCYHECT